ncbi:MAG: hypothetical protein OEY29_10125 [Gammaproteobacteria bacterium]|nr:hypothetical protein [Gammaproteobacteria bacterium]
MIGCDTAGEGAAQIQIGSANEVSSIQGLQYQQPLVVQVTDLDGNPVAGASVSVRVVPVEYFKGIYIRIDANGLPAALLADAVRWGSLISAYCPTEDLNDNAVLDAGEDINGNVVLDPSHPATLTPHASALPTLDPISNRILTDDSGFGYFSITYPESVASWVAVRIIASTRVLGTESTQTMEVDLLAPLPDLEEVDIAPPGGSTESPYGVANVCTDAN